VIFNDGPLSLESITDADISPIDLSSAPAEISQNLKWCASCAWTSNCDWYFVVTPDGIVLLNVFTCTGMFCKKLSARFIEAFIDTPWKGKRRGS